MWSRRCPAQVTHPPIPNASPCTNPNLAFDPLEPQARELLTNTGRGGDLG